MVKVQKMTRNISQTMCSSSVPPSSNTDEHSLLRYSYKSLLFNKRCSPSTAQSNFSTQRQSRCVSWAPDTRTLNLANLSNKSQQRDYRRNVTRSWYSGQSCSGVSPAKSGPTVGPYGSFTSTIVADTGILLSPTQTQPLLAPSPHKTSNIQIQKQIQNKQTQRPPPLQSTEKLNAGIQKPPQITITSVGGTPPISPILSKKKTARYRGIDLIIPGLR